MFMYQRMYLGKGRNTRQLEHQKSSRDTLGDGAPTVVELKQGVASIRDVAGKGVYAFFVFNGQKYYTKLTKGTP